MSRRTLGYYRNGTWYTHTQKYKEDMRKKDTPDPSIRSVHSLFKKSSEKGNSFSKKDYLILVIVSAILGVSLAANLFYFLMR